jgi:formylglycine-generating enzyme required for sulfatase activity
MKLQALFFILIVAIEAGAVSPPAGMVEVKAGAYKLFYKEKDQKELAQVSSFFIDKFPVTNKDYLEFVKKNPEWKKSAVPTVFATTNYLQSWPSAEAIPAGKENYPVVSVSWFAARKYCEVQGKRLLTVNEWEYASDSENPANSDTIIEWYGKPNSQLGAIKSGKANKFGVYDMHGLIWEWVEDYASVMIKGDSRSDNSREKNLFCGSGSLGAASAEEYATFMRFAFRSSLKGNYVTENLGFRCGKDIQP